MFTDNTVKYIHHTIGRSVIAIAIATSISACAPSGGNNGYQIGSLNLPLSAGEPLPSVVAVAISDQSGETITDDASTRLPPSMPPVSPSPGLNLATVGKQMQDLSSSYQGLTPAIALVGDAEITLKRGSTDQTLMYMVNSANAIGEAIDALSRVTPTDATITNIQLKLLTSVEEMADATRVAMLNSDPSSTIYQLAQRSFDLGLQAKQTGQYQLASSYFEEALNYGGNNLSFSIQSFEHNVMNAFINKTTGFSVAIAYQGNLYQGGNSAGLARTSADAPETPQSVDKPMHVASVSKTITTLMVLDLLEGLGLSPDTKIAAFLPNNWARGTNVNQLSFRHLMTHRSGAGQYGTGNTYAQLQTFIADGPGNGFDSMNPPEFDYNNGNFAMMRVLLPGLMGIDVTSYPMLIPEFVASGAFQSYADQFYGQIGINLGCNSLDPNPTIQYDYPPGIQPGYDEPSRSLECGGYGWFASAAELASIMTHMRNTNVLIGATARNWMQDDYLGLMRPDEYDFSTGVYGEYYNHGGDWFHGERELHSCVMAFPIQVEVAVLINSKRGPGVNYQCRELKNAFEASWTL